MENLAYYNGNIAPIEAMTIPMDDRVSWFGDGVYDVTVCRNHRVFALEDHVRRFFRSAALVEIEPPLTEAALGELLESLVRRVDSPTQLVHWQVTRGTALREHTFPRGAAPNLWVMLRPWTVPDLEKKISLITEEDRRFFFCHIKTLNLLPNVLASEKAKRAGCTEAVFHRKGRVTECSHSNVHILKDGVFRTAPTDELILPGIARSHLIAACKALGVPVREEAFTVDDLFSADEVLTSSCTTFCFSACSLDGRPVGGKAPDLLKKLQNAVMEEFFTQTAA